MQRTLDIIENFQVKALNTTRTIRVLLPKNYNKEIKYPVIYMHDGQNLFEEETSFAGHWKIKESIDLLIDKFKIPGFIVVGIDNSSNRMNEYTPNWSDSNDALGLNYAKFIAEELMPYINSNYSTNKDFKDTLIMGSSMGGLISFYTALLYPNLFGMAACLSTSFQINSIEARNEFIESLKIDNNYPVIYLDAGTEEHSMNYISDVKDALIKNGYNKNKIYTHIELNHAHNEEAWQKRFPKIIKLLYKLDK